MRPTVADLEAFLGAEDALDVSNAERVLATVEHMVRAYVRDQGFTDGTPGDDIAAVIVSAAARLIGNPTAMTHEQTGPFSIRPGTFSGWTLPELAVLHRHRVRAQ